MKRVIFIFHDPDSYEILIEHNTILRITKILGDSQIPVEYSFNELTEEIQNQIVNKINEYIRRVN